MACNKILVIKSQNLQIVYEKVPWSLKCNIWLYGSTFRSRHASSVEHVNQCTNKYNINKSSYPDKPILRLKFFGVLNRIIDQAKPRGFATTKMGPELEHKDGIWILNLVHSWQLLLQLGLQYNTEVHEDEEIGENLLNYPSFLTISTSIRNSTKIDMHNYYSNMVQNKEHTSLCIKSRRYKSRKNTIRQRQGPYLRACRHFTSILNQITKTLSGI